MAARKRKIRKESAFLAGPLDEQPTSGTLAEPSPGARENDRASVDDPDLPLPLNDLIPVMTSSASQAAPVIPEFHRAVLPAGPESSSNRPRLSVDQARGRRPIRRSELRATRSRVLLRSMAAVLGLAALIGFLHFIALPVIDGAWLHSVNR